jgi:hypothetical protein
MAGQAASAQQDVHTAIDKIEDRLTEQQRQLSAQAAVIEDQQRRLARQDRELAEFRERTDGRPTAARAAERTESRTKVNDDVEPAQLLVAPLSVPATNHPSATPPGQALGPGERRILYDNGIILAGANDADPISMRVNGRFQFRHTAFDSDGQNRDENQVELERARLVFSGNAFSPDLFYFAQLDGDSDDRAQVDMIDYYLNYDIGHGVWGCESGLFGVKVGKYRMPFARARQDSGFMLQFVDRATGSDFFDINRSLGVSLLGATPIGDQKFGWEAAIFNGFRDDRFAPNRAGELDRNPGYAVRVTRDFISPWGTDGEPDLSWHEQPSIKIGAAAAFTRVDRDDGASEFTTVPALANSGLNPFVVDVVPAAVDEFSVLLFAVDANLKYRGLSVLGEYYFRELTDFVGAPVADRFDHGFTLQTGYFVCREKLELVTRWSRVVGDSWSLGETDHSSDELAAGVNWYFRGHDLKIGFDVSHFNGVPLSSSTLNVLAGDVGWLFRTQLQLLF